MPTILVVDDSEVDRRLAGNWVEKSCDAEVLYANDGEDALVQIAASRPDVVLTDMQMPKLDGLQLVSAIKAGYPRIPVILMTAKGSEEVAAEALRLGAASYVPKRLLAEMLPGTIQRVLKGAREVRSHSHLMHHLTENESTFVIFNDLSLIQALVGHVQELLRCLPLSDEMERMRVGIAVEEALRNAYYHGNLEIASAECADENEFLELAGKRRYESPYCERRIFLRVRLSREEAVFHVRDEGPGFDTSHLPDIADPQEEDQPAARGIRLMRSIMDEVSYNETGNEVTLVKRRIPVEVFDDDDLDDDDEIEEEDEELGLGE